MAIIVCIVIRLSGKDEHEIITVEQVKEMEAAYIIKGDIKLYEQIVSGPSSRHLEPYPDTRLPDPHQDTFSKTVFGFWLYLMTDCLFLPRSFAHMRFCITILLEALLHKIFFIFRPHLLKHDFVIK